MPLCISHVAVFMPLSENPTRLTAVKPRVIPTWMQFHDSVTETAIQTNHAHQHDVWRLYSMFCDQKTGFTSLH